MADSDGLTIQSMPGGLDSSQIESVRVLNETPTDEAITSSSLLWFLRWFNETPDLSDAPREDVEEDSSPNISNQAPDPPSFVLCHICMDEIAGHEAIFVPFCQHTFCRDCLSTYVIGKLREGRYPIHCPCCTTEDRTDVRK